MEVRPMLKRLCSLLLILALLFTLLPAQADITPLTAQEIASARAFIAMEGGSWQQGMAITADMNALQVQQYLEWLLSDEIGGLMNQVLDSAELLNLGQAGRGASITGVGLTLQQLRNRIASHRDTLVRTAARYTAICCSWAATPICPRRASCASPSACATIWRKCRA